MGVGVLSDWVILGGHVAGRAYDGAVGWAVGDSSRVALVLYFNDCDDKINIRCTASNSNLLGDEEGALSGIDCRGHEGSDDNRETHSDGLLEDWSKVEGCRVMLKSCMESWFFKGMDDRSQRVSKSWGGWRLGC